MLTRRKFFIALGLATTTVTILPVASRPINVVCVGGSIANPQYELQASWVDSEGSHHVLRVGDQVLDSTGRLATIKKFQRKNHCKHSVRRVLAFDPKTYPR